MTQDDLTITDPKMKAHGVDVIHPIQALAAVES